MPSTVLVHRIFRFTVLTVAGRGAGRPDSPPFRTHRAQFGDGYLLPGSGVWFQVFKYLAIGTLNQCAELLYG
jgi:hypothetical protein